MRLALGRSNKLGKSALYLVASRLLLYPEGVVVISLLLDCGVGIIDRDIEGAPPFDLAHRESNTNVCDFLLAQVAGNGSLPSSRK